MNSLFWLEQPLELVRDIKFVPKKTMKSEDKSNTITRLVIVIFLILYLLNYKYSFLFLLLSIFIIIILYYLQRETMTESYVDTRKPHTTQPFIENMEKLYESGKKEYKTNRYTVQKFPSYYANRQEATESIPNQTFISKNQRLAGGPNPKTLVAPIITPPSYDWEYWKGNDFIFPSIINEKRTQDWYGSGYITTDEPVIESFEDRPRGPAPPQAGTYEAYRSEQNNSQADSNNPYYANSYKSPQDPLDYLGDYNGKYKIPVKNGQAMGTEVVVPKDRVKRSLYKSQDYQSFSKTDGVQKYPGDINKSCTYDASNLDYNLPSNMMAGNCERNTNVSELNKQIFTSTVTPGVYYNTQIIEPFNSNIGISFDQQIPPRKVTREKNGDLLYTAMDPSLYQPEKEIDHNDYGTAPYEVYDPRTNGYGTGDRTYVHTVTGQPRFFYDDVNAVRRPNYITRTNIDHLLDADSYGITRTNGEIITNNCDIRNIAEKGLMNNFLDHRTDMMNRLMRKTNAEQWQQRMAPIRKGATYTMSGGASVKK